MPKHLIKLSVILLMSFCILLGTSGYGSMILGTFDIQIYDTYFVTEWWPLLVILFLLLGFTSYLSSVLANGFKEKSANLILMAFTITLLALVFVYSHYKNMSYGDEGGWVVYPPLSAMAGEFMKSMRRWTIILICFKAALFGLLGLLVFQSFLKNKIRKP